jgi:hypothetical protein
MNPRQPPSLHFGPQCRPRSDTAEGTAGSATGAGRVGRGLVPGHLFLTYGDRLLRELPAEGLEVLLEEPPQAPPRPASRSIFA